LAIVVLAACLAISHWFRRNDAHCYDFKRHQPDNPEDE
jgi:hypothetical protein